MNNKRLYKDSENGSIAGVCAGLAEYLNMDVSTLRIIVVLIALFSGSTLIVPYILFAIFLPDKKDIIGQEQDGPAYQEPKKEDEDDLYTYDEDEYKY